MKVTKLAVEYSELRSFPGEFGNTKPRVAYLEVEVQEGEDPEAVKRDLMEKATATVRNTIVRALQTRLPDLFEEAERRGECPNCGKSMPALPPCPECGQL